jgi:hypothetical protein
MLCTLLGGCETNEHDNAAYPRITVTRDAEPPKEHSYPESNRSNAWFKVDEEAVKQMFLDHVDLDVIADTTGRNVRSIAQRLLKMHKQTPFLSEEHVASFFDMTRHTTSSY